nr:hypothetical protein [Tanacetum cinerariifolium]
MARCYECGNAIHERQRSLGLSDLLPDGKIIGSKWLFKKKTDMDGVVHTYKARLVAKGFTQTYKVDYEETFSPVVDIRDIRILVAIPAFYDYEFWQMNVKTTFLNVHLSKEVYMVQPEGCVIPKLSKLNLGEAAYFLGSKIYKDRSRRLISLCQSVIEKIFKRFHMEKSKRGSIPMQDTPKLCKSQGASTHAENPCDLHWTAIKNILKYLRNTKDMFPVYGGDIKRMLRVSCYTDAGYLMDADDLKSQTGYVFVLNGTEVDWKNTKQSIFVTSFVEPEYIAAYDASKEAVWIRKFIFRLGVVPTNEEPIMTYCDNIKEITIANESGTTKGARHYRAKVHYIREVIELGNIKIEKVFRVYGTYTHLYTDLCMVYSSYTHRSNKQRIQTGLTES